MASAGSSPPPTEPPWSAERIEAALPGPLRAQFRREHLSFLALWQAEALRVLQPPGPVDPAPARTVATHKWGDLMDDWEL